MRYLDESSTPVNVKYQTHDYEIIEHPLLSFDNKLVRHDPMKVKTAFEEILREI